MNKAEERRLFASINETPIPTVITDMRVPDYPIAAVNDAFTLLTGYSKEEAVGRNCRFLQGPETEPWSSATLREAVLKAGSAMTELINYRKDGTPFRNAVMIAPIFDEAGKLTYYLGSQMEVPEGAKLPSIVRRQQASELVKGLTPRQREVLQQMTQGYRNKQIAIRLGVSEKTVKMHRAALLMNLNVPTSADAVRIGVEAGL